MTGDDDSGNPARLPLAERIRRGLLADEELLELQEIAALEYPSIADKEDRRRFLAALVAAIQGGDLAAMVETKPATPAKLPRSPDPRIRYRPLPGNGRYSESHTVTATKIRRNDYRTWRATLTRLPAPLVSHIVKWLDDAPAPAPLPQGEPDRPEQGAAGTQNPATNRQCVVDKARFLEMATWKGTQQATVNQHPEAAYFKGKYYAPTLSKWASEIDPRPKNQRGGRSRKSSS